MQATKYASSRQWKALSLPSSDTNGFLPSPFSKWLLGLNMSPDSMKSKCLPRWTLFLVYSAWWGSMDRHCDGENQLSVNQIRWKNSQNTSEVEENLLMPVATTPGCGTPVFNLTGRKHHNWDRVHPSIPPWIWLGAAWREFIACDHVRQRDSQRSEHVMKTFPNSWCKQHSNMVILTLLCII